MNAGCLSIEADVRLLDNGSVVLSHDGADQLDFKGVFVKRVLGLVEDFSIGGQGYSDDLKEKFRGIYTTSTSLSVQLAIDIKTDPIETLRAVMEAFEPLRERNLLSFYDESLRKMTDEEMTNSSQYFPKNVHQTPNPWLLSDEDLRRIGVVRSVFTVVFTGNIAHEYIKGLPKRYFFFDGYLKDRHGPIPESPSFCPMASGIWPQLKTWDQTNVTAILNKYHAKGISTRVYEVPGWPIWKRNEIWVDLHKLGVSWVNADDLQGAANL